MFQSKLSPSEVCQLLKSAAKLELENESNCVRSFLDSLGRLIDNSLIGVSPKELAVYVWATVHLRIPISVSQRQRLLCAVQEVVLNLEKEPYLLELESDAQEDSMLTILLSEEGSRLERNHTEGAGAVVSPLTLVLYYFWLLQLKKQKLETTSYIVPAQLGK